MLLPAVANVSIGSSNSITILCLCCHSHGKQVFSMQ